MDRSRYGIQTSYRQMNQGRIRTCTLDRIHPSVAGGCCAGAARPVGVVNLWVWLHRSLRGRVRGICIELRLELLRLRQRLLMLQRCTEAWLGCRQTGQISNGPQTAATL